MRSCDWSSDVCSSDLPGLDRKAVEKALGGVPVEVERAMELAGRIAPVLADGARGNPRQIKRFINTMMLRLAIAEERGFRDELKRSEEHTSELQSLMRISYAVFCLKTKTKKYKHTK